MWRGITETLDFSHIDGGLTCCYVLLKPMEALMRDSDNQNAELSETQESVDGDELIELGDLTKTKGGIGVHSDSLGGLAFN